MNVLFCFIALYDPIIYDSAAGVDNCIKAVGVVGLGFVADDQVPSCVILDLRFKNTVQNGLLLTLFDSFSDAGLLDESAIVNKNLSNILT